MVFTSTSKQMYVENIYMLFEQKCMFDLPFSKLNMNSFSTTPT